MSEPTFTPAEIRRMAERTIEYLLSPEGKEQMRKHQEEMRKLEALFQKARNIPWERLHEPFTI